VNNLEEAKRLLKNAMATNDQDLILLANKLLEGTEDKKSEPKPASQPTAEDNSDFLATITTDEKRIEGHRGVAVNLIKDRANTFHDDGSIADDIKTPTFKPIERKRLPYKTIEQKCQKCDKVVQVNPIHKRDFFVCDKCLIK
tara:strand:+ start:380 stop:805 length:426 start_codon:yes stop_codon:yes gene_type:complete